MRAETCMTQSESESTLSNIRGLYQFIPLEGEHAGKIFRVTFRSAREVIAHRVPMQVPGVHFPKTTKALILDRVP